MPRRARRGIALQGRTPAPPATFSPSAMVAASEPEDGVDRCDRELRALGAEAWELLAEAGRHEPCPASWSLVRRLCALEARLRAAAEDLRSPAESLPARVLRAAARDVAPDLASGARECADEILRVLSSESETRARVRVDSRGESSILVVPDRSYDMDTRRLAVELAEPRIPDDLRVIDTVDGVIAFLRGR